MIHKNYGKLWENYVMNSFIICLRSSKISKEVRVDFYYLAAGLDHGLLSNYLV